MFKNLLRLSLNNSSEPLQLARVAKVGTVICENEKGAEWMRSKGCKAFTIADLESEDFDPAKIDPTRPVFLTTKALHALAAKAEENREKLVFVFEKLNDARERHRKIASNFADQKADLQKEIAQLKEHNLKAKARIQDLLTGNANLTRELSEARRPWYSKMFGRRAVK